MISIIYTYSITTIKLEKITCRYIKYRQMKTKKYIITKRIAKHGNQAIIVIPRILESQLKPGTIAEITIEILEGK